jgi:glutathione S-transferase
MDLYHNNMSVCSQKVRLVIHEKNPKPVEHHLNLRAGDQSSPEYLKLNPNGVVPTIVESGQPIIESTVICEYLEEAYPNSPLRPKSPIERAMTRASTLLPDAGLHVACGATSFSIAFRHQYLALPRDQLERQLAEKPDAVARERQRQMIERGLEAPSFAPAIRMYDKILTRMSRQLDTTPWLAGNEYGLADVGIIPYVLRLEHLQLAWMWERARPAIGRWLERCKKRSNYSAIANYLDSSYLDLGIWRHNFSSACPTLKSNVTRNRRSPSRRPTN